MTHDQLYDMTVTEIATSKATAAVRIIMAQAQHRSALDAFPPGAMHRNIVEAWHHDRIMGKAAVPGLGGGVLLPPVLTKPLIALADATAILPRLNAQRVVFDLPVPIETAPMAASWVAAGAAKPISAGQLTNATLTRDTIVSMVVVSNELLKYGGATAEAWLRGALARAVAVGIDTALLSTSAANSILDGVTPTTGTGTPDGDLKALLSAFTGSVEHAVLVMSSRNAVAAALSGDPFAELTPAGGMAGVPVVAGDSAGDAVVLVDTSRLLYADEGELAIVTSTDAALEMDDAPTGSALTPTAVSLVSLFQTNSTAIRAERYVAWQALDGAVAWIDDVDYTAGA
jgi:hypothetical protein